MKKIHIAIAVLITATLTSCQEEKSFNGVPVGKGDVAFVLQSGPATRAANLDTPETKGINVPIGKAGNMNIYLEETITDLGSATPETRGVPVFTENVGKLYSNKLFVHAKGGGFGDAVFETMDGSMVGGGWRYTHHYGSVDPWPANDGAVDFYLRIPSDMTGVTFGNDAYADGTKTIFTYTSPTTAANQQDIVFAGINLKKSVHDTNLPDGTPVTFYHALTAVKFAIANPSSEISEETGKGINVTNISFIGLNNTGTCTVDPNATGDKVTWDDVDATEITDETTGKTSPNVIQQDFDFSKGELVEFNKTNNPDFGDSFFNPGDGTAAKPGTDKQNINKQDASKTFWLVPQAFAGSTAILRITYVMSGKEEYMDLKLGEVLANVEWKAGQLRTYTIRLDEVNVKIADTVHMAAETKQKITIENIDYYARSFENSYKDGVVITNTGNTDAYIRAALIGQWYDYKENEPVFGYTDFTGGSIQSVDSWYQDQFINTVHTHGTFEGLVGYDGAPSDYWELWDDGFYYYKYVVPANNGTIPGAYKIVDAAGKATDKAAPATPNTQPLFSKYTVGKTPAVVVGGVVKDVYFVLEVATQAISAKKLDGTYYTLTEAWKHANEQINEEEE